MSNLTEGVPPVQRPTIGRAVHYVSYGTPPREDGTQAYTSQCRAATVTEVDAAEPFNVGLHITNPTGQAFQSLADGGCMNDETEHQGGTWHWPERV
ncbi:hypothetical protein [Amycolatopsis kentuckyensis]|uniref:hypothetical protein n=1 Tax=Amycolatopsis kentuckyensis TaxID=218823 RepID=UPI00356B59AC